MDKALGIVTLLFVGAPLVILTLAIGGFMDDDRNKRHSNSTLSDDSDMRIYVPKRSRCRRGDHRRIIQVDAEGREING